MYGFDWRLIVAVMRVESGFSATAESQKGAAGFMQMMPTTSEEVGKSLDIDDMAHPSNNIKGGVYYLARLFRLFESSEQTDRVKLTLAAYNAGIGRIYDAQELAAYFHESPAKWSAVREALPLLSKRYYTLHKNIWSQDRPKSGWFGNSRETIAYVDKIMRCYDEYRESLN
jgi:membrane-bound lytic murein transglycosylase F